MYQLLNDIKQVLEGEATEVELNNLFMQLNDKEQELYQFWIQNIQADVPMSKETLPEPERNKIKQQLLDQINATGINPGMSIENNSVPISVNAITIPTELPTATRSPLLKVTFPFLRFAVAAAAIICIIVLGFHFHQNEKSTASQLPAIAQQTTYSITATTVSKTILLQDSTLVTLSPGTILHYDNTYNLHDRKLYLHGVAVFNVKSNPGKPFTVYSKHLSTTALGTTFEIIESQDSTIVHLVEGSVKVRNYNHPTPTTLFLNAGEKAVCNNAQPALTIIKAIQPTHDRIPAKTAKSAVTINDLAFNQEPLENVLEQLTKHYKVPINYNKTHISNIIFTGTFSEDASLAAVLQVIATINNLTIHPDKYGFSIVK